MAGKGAPIGNDYATKSQPWRSALTRAIVQDDGKRLRAAAEKLLNLAEAGEAWAVKELADRLDGKAAQSIVLAGDAENPLALTVSHGMELDSVQLLEKVRGIEK